MAGLRFGGWWARGVGGVGVGVVLTFARVASAQSTASFPDPTGKPPSAQVALPAASVSAPPAPSVSPSAAPQASAPNESTTDSRYPVLPSAAPATAAPAPSAGLGLSPAVLPFRDGLPIPPGYRVEHRSANGLIAGGLVTLVVAYGAALAVGASDGFKNGTGWLVVPVAGPWAAIGARSFHCNNDPLKANDCVESAFSEVQTIAILSADAVVQATGAVLFLAGLGSGRDELVRTDVLSGVRVTPFTVGSGGVGMGVAGRF